MVRKELHTSALLTLPAFESHVCTQGSGCLLIVYPVFSVCRCRSRISYLRKEKSCTPKRIYPHRRYRKSSGRGQRSEEHTSELQSRQYLVCRLLLEKKKNQITHYYLSNTQRH